jgi:hypothetical protein
VSSCSAENNGRRCQVSCRSPEVAQCFKPADAADARCICQ